MVSRLKVGIFVTSKFFAVFPISLKIDGKVRGFTKRGKESEEPQLSSTYPNPISIQLASARTLAATSRKTAL